MVLAGDTGVVHFYFNDFNNKDELIRTIRSLPHDQSQYNLASALKVTREQLFDGQNGDREEVENAVIVLSAGRPTVDYELVRRNLNIRTHGMKLPH